MATLVPAVCFIVNKSTVSIIVLLPFSLGRTAGYSLMSVLLGSIDIKLSWEPHFNNLFNITDLIILELII